MTDQKELTEEERGVLIQQYIEDRDYLRHALAVLLSAHNPAAVYEIAADMVLSTISSEYVAGNDSALVGFAAALEQIKQGNAEAAAE